VLNKAALAAEPRWKAASTILQGRSVPLVVEGVMLISGVWREKKEGRILLDEMK
jgi:hypothetical protein